MSNIKRLNELTESYRGIRDSLEDYRNSFHDEYKEKLLKANSFMDTDLYVEFRISWSGSEYVIILTFLDMIDINNWLDYFHNDFMEKYNVKLCNYTFRLGMDDELELKYYDKNSLVDKTIDIDFIKEIGRLLER